MPREIRGASLRYGSGFSREYELSRLKPLPHSIILFLWAAHLPPL